MDHEPLLQDELDENDLDQPIEEEAELDNSMAIDSSQYLIFFVCVFGLKFFTQFTNGLIEVPIIRLLEQTICKSKFDSSVAGNGSEADCKTPAVQDKLALILGFKFAFDSLPCKLTSSRLFQC